MKKLTQNLENENISIKNRSQRIAQIIQVERKQIYDDLKKQFQICANRWERSCSDPNKVEYCYEGLSNFMKACINVIDVYFPILSSELMISLQAQACIQSRINNFKSSVIRSLKSTAQKLFIHYDLSQQQQPVEKKQSKRRLRLKRKLSKSSNPQKSSNTKIPASKSAYLTEWLLLNFKNPYPSIEQKIELAKKSNLHQRQVNNWFINVRERDIKKYIKNDNKSQAKDKTSKKKKNKTKVQEEESL